MIIQRAMGALAIVEAFDVIEDFAARLAVADKVAPINQFQFEGAPEAFHGGVVVAVAFAAHGGEQAGLAQGLAVSGAGVLDAPIGVEQQLGWWVAVQEGHGQRF